MTAVRALLRRPRMLRVRASIARRLVRMCSYFIDRAYGEYCKRGDAEWFGLAAATFSEWAWASFGRFVDLLALPFARRLDARATGEQMANEGWWG